ncbi:MAG: glutaminase [Ornithinimicrobium sp.]
MRSPLQEHLDAVHRDLLTSTQGQVAEYAEALADLDPDQFGIAVTTLDGTTYASGDAETLFAIQSISKAFTYGLALADSGFASVDAKIDVEPSGEAFNEISLQAGTGRPANALINAGAIAAASMVSEHTPLTPSRRSGIGRSGTERSGTERSGTGRSGTGRSGTERSGISRIVSAYSALAGRQLCVDDRVLAIERAEGDRNLALAHLLRSFGIIDGSAEEVADDYFAACAITVSARDLSMMAAVLATGGVHPVTGERLLSAAVVSRVLSVMSTCGMYDDAGEWMVRVGLPAKSGVGGGIIAVVPGQIGIAVYSPRLDHHGNSVRGVLACERLSSEFALHLMRGAQVSYEAVRVMYPITEAPSGVRRQPVAQEALVRHGHRALVIEVQGDLTFGATESVLRELVTLPTEVEFVVLDVRRIIDVIDFARTGLHHVDAAYAEQDRVIVVVDDAEQVGTASGAGPRQVFALRRQAIEWVEEQLLARYCDAPSHAEQVDAADALVLSGLDAAATAALTTAMTRQRYARGDVVLHQNQEFCGIFVITRGLVDTTVADSEGDQQRLTVLGPGMSFGEFGIIGDGRHAATVTALEDLEVEVLTPPALSAVERNDPALALQLWRAISQDAFTRVREQLAEVGKTPGG